MTATPQQAQLTYQDRIAKINAALTANEIDQETADQLKKQAAEAEYGAKSFDIGEFESLLSRLEGSKMRQQRQKSVEGRRDIMSQGLASMMSNF
jgi:hypothetical protein